MNYTQKVDFSYAFGTPHRMCISTPEASKKCLLDCTEKGVTVLWSDDDLTKIPLGAFYGPKVQWYFDIFAEVNGESLEGKEWRRIENRLPGLEYIWSNDTTEIKLNAVSGRKWDIIKFNITNLSSNYISASIIGKTRDLSFNSKWIDRASNYNALFAHYGDRSDRILFVSTINTGSLRSCSNLDVDLKLDPKSNRTFFIIRPHRMFFDDLEKLVKHDWESELNSSLDVWRSLMNKAAKYTIPDKMVEDAYYACFGDIFVARELSSEGFMAGLAGTDLYRCMNTCEPIIAATVLDQSGLYLESEYVMRGILSFQDEKTGRWDDHRRWGHEIWWIPGPRCRWIKEHYMFTRDKKFLSMGLAQMLKHVRWADGERQKTKILNDDGSKPLSYGLMPRGMGDGGLMDDDDLYGIYIPSNVWHCYIIKIALWAAAELGLNVERIELQKYYDDALECTLDAMRRGAIIESDGSKWIPGVPGKTSGSRFAATNAVYPCGIIDPFDELADGTLKKLESNISEGGLPMDTGWLKGGLWVAMAIDNLAYAHIARQEYDEAANYLYPTLNHATPLFTWCEERLPEPGSKTITGDLQHTWTPHIVNRFLRDSLLMEIENSLHIASAIPREWLSTGQRIGTERANTQFGLVDYSVIRESEEVLKFNFSLIERVKPAEVILHLRIPEKNKKFSCLSNNSDSIFNIKGEKIIFAGSCNFIEIIIKIS